MMVEAWKECLLGDVLNFKRGYDLPRKKRSPGPFPVVSSAGVTDHHSEAKVEGPGVVTGRYGTLGQVFYIESNFWPLNTSLYVQDFKGNDPRFISYFLSTLKFESQNAAGAVPGVNRNHLHSMGVRIPPLPMQQRIAGRLSAYDELIENNQRRIEILESLAHALYREWFVHFRFPGHENQPRVDSPLGEIPEGWEMKALGGVATITMGLSPKGDTYNDEGNGTPLVNGPVEFGERFTKEVKWTTAPSKLCNDGDLIVCVRGSTTGKYVKSNGVYCLGRGVCSMSSKYQSFIDQLFESELPVLLGQTSGSTFPSWTGPQLKAHPIICPPDGVLSHFDLVVKPLNSAILVYARKIENLHRTRDLLLPRLLSGQVEIEAA